MKDLDPAAVGAGVVPQPVWQDIFDTNASDPGYSQFSQAVPAAKDQSNIRQDSDDVSRQFKLITVDNMGAAPSGKNGPTFIGTAHGPNWSDDPYEYAWYSDQQGSLNANVGILVFNPAGHTSAVVNGNVTDAQSQQAGQAYANSQSLTARVDYLIYDNHIIRDQRTMPANGPYTVKLTLPNVLTNGDLLDDASAFTGLFQGSVNTTPDIFVYDANTGAELSEMSQGIVPQNKGFVNFTLDPVSGALTFVAATTANYVGVEDPNGSLQGRPLRILYRTQKNWGQQVQKASSAYTPAATLGSVNYKTFFVGDGNSGTLPTRLYFSQSEAGKTVNIGEFYLKTATGSIFAPFKNETFKIDDNPANFVNGYPSIDITATHPQSDAEHLAQGATTKEDITGFTAIPTGRAVNFARGLSIKSRVIWKSSGRFRQIDEDSVLPTDRP